VDQTLQPTTETTIKCLKTERLAPNEEILHDAIICKSNADTGFNIFEAIILQ